MTDVKVELIDHMGSDLTVVNAARVSFNKESKWEYEEWKGDPIDGPFLSDKDAKLIAYLASHNHWTPFSHPQATFRIKAPIFVARQLFKHKVGLTENEVSRRYVDDEPEMFWPTVWRKAPTSGAKQGSSDEPFIVGNVLVKFERVYELALEAYNEAISKGMCPEQARIVLPQAMMTEWWWTGSLAAFARVYSLRMDPHAQRETQEVVEKIGQALEPLFPHSWKALTEAA